MFYLDDPKGLGDLLWAIIPDIKGLIQMAIVGLITWLATRPKTTAEIHKTQADTDQVKATTVQTLLNEIDDLILKVRSLRKQVEDSEDERGVIRAEVRKIIGMVQLLLDQMTNLNVVQTIRMQAVRVLEGLYRVKEKLKDEDTPPAPR